MNNFKRMAIVAVVVLAGMFAGCKWNDIPTDFPTPEPPPAAAPAPKLELKPDAELEKQIAKIAEESKGKVGVAAVVLETGESASLNGGEHFPMQSVYKLPIAMAVMEQVRLGKLNLDEQIGVTKEDFVREGQRSPLRDANPNGGEFTIRELIQLALVESDGTASDVLMRVAGGPGDIQSYLTQIGIKDIKVVNTEKEIGRDWQTQYQNWATPMAAVELLRWLDAAGRNASVNERASSGTNTSTLPDGRVSAHDDNGAQLLLKFMTDSNPGAKRLKGLLPKGTVVAHKTGTSGTQNGVTAATNDIGIITLPNGKHIGIAVFVSDSPADEKIREAVIAKIAKAIWDRWRGSSNGNIANLRRTKCATAKTVDEHSLCNAVMSKFDKEDDPTFREFEVTSRDADLNGDGRDETVAWISSWGGTSGQVLFILSKGKNRYIKLFEQDTTWTPIILQESKSNGWRDFAYLVAGGGVEVEFVIVKHDGNGYKKTKFQREKPEGKIFIDQTWAWSILGPTSNQ